MRGSLLLVAVGVLAAGVIAPSAPAVGAPRGWSLPPGAREVAPDVWEIGSREVNGRTLTGYAILDHGHEAKGGGKPGGGSGGGSTGGYAYISSGLKWKTLGEPYRVDPTIAAGSDASMTPTYISGVVAGAIGKWELAAGGGTTPKDVFGSEESGAVDRASVGVGTNGHNEVMFGEIAQDGVIAVTFVWGYYGGPPQTREIVEWDQIYDDRSFQWGDVTGTGRSDVMDFENICTHEVGHAFGMDHPSSTYTEETMYAYATQGETKKRSLDVGDKAGIDKLY